MNISAIAIKRPVFTVMVTVALLVLGAVGLSRLGTDLFPDVSFPVVIVNIVYPGASPAEVENLVSKPLEDAVVSLNGLDRVRDRSRARGSRRRSSSSSSGSTSRRARRSVRERVAQTRVQAPGGGEGAGRRAPRSVARRRCSSTRCAGQGSLSQIRKYADDVLRPALEQVDGVAARQHQGRRRARGPRRPRPLAPRRARPLARGHPRRAARRQPHRPRGPLRRVDARDQRPRRRRAGTVEQIREWSSRPRRTAPRVRLRDVANVEDGWEEMRTRIRSNGDEAVSFEVVKQSGRNTVAIADAVKAQLAALEKAFPPGMRAELILDSSRVHPRERARGRDRHRLRRGDGDPRSSSSSCSTCGRPSSAPFALPTSVIATFFLMYVLGFTLNMMTLLGLSLAIGLLIDDAVVVRENIFKHLERGEPPREAALRGTEEIALSVLATTLTIVAVFVPVAFMSGIVGQFFRQFGLTVSAGDAHLALRRLHARPDALVALLAGACEQASATRSRSSSGPSRRRSTRWMTLYRGLLGWSLRHKRVVGRSRSARSSGWGTSRSQGSEFVSEEDRGQMVLDIELPAGTSLEETRGGAPRSRRRSSRTALRHPPRDARPRRRHNKTSMRDRHRPQAGAHGGPARDQGRRCGASPLKIPGAKVAITPPPFVEGAGDAGGDHGASPGRRRTRRSRPTPSRSGGRSSGIPGVTDVQVR